MVQGFAITEPNIESISHTLRFGVEIAILSLVEPRNALECQVELLKVR